MESTSYTTLKELFTTHGQGHIFDHYESLSPEGQSLLLDEARQIDPALTNRLYRDLVNSHAPAKSSEGGRGFLPIELEMVQDRSQLGEGEREIGNALIREGSVAVVVLAGGQGTRLGSDRPKGEYNIGLPSGKSIFQILTERYIKAQQLAGGAVQKCKLLIMTSELNHKQTIQFYEENHFFGAVKENVIFFMQSMIPLISSSNGKIIMEEPHKISIGPNGNGALFDAVQRYPEVKAVIESVKYVQVIGVDNVLNRLLDPLFIGFTHQNQLQASMKSCVKRDATEPVGAVMKRVQEDGSTMYDIVEYSEITKEDATAINPATGELKFNLGNILVFLIRADLLMKLCKNVETLNSLYHKAHKKVPFWDFEQNALIKPTAPNCWKFELFIHNFLPFCEPGSFGVLKVSREDEFGPVKNAEGVDSPQTARDLIFGQGQRWLSKAGATVAEGVKVELDVMLSYEGEGLEEKYAGKEIGEQGAATYIK
ncbi:hypothetical protein FGO68_gene5121 [Halteria grandinella]|uniref:UDP-N-acetylglucosamine diphosphorylase n=1 Tax=Halteria grandinella TaxID=5974 RepID=A0A8J8NNZ4_HALGN|nr:hypothetical protein FGO68_gene5121 [Halteria grandinella]